MPQDKSYDKWIVFVIVAAGTFMSMLSASSINVALPVIQSIFAAPLSGIQWVVTAYLLVISSVLPVFGWAGDMLQRRYVIAAGFLFFGLGSLACGWSVSLSELIVARLIQGLGASMIMANSYAAITGAFPLSQRGQALGMQGSMVALGGISGPAVGGILIELFGWRSVFYITLPFAVFGAVMALLYIPKVKVKVRQRFDFLGSVLLVGAISFMILSVSQWGRPGWSDVEIAGYFALSLGLFAGFYYWEQRVEFPVLDLGMFGNKVFLHGNLAGLCSFLALSSNNMLLPFYLHRVVDSSPKFIGMVMMVFPLMMVIVAPLSGYLSDRYGAPRFSLAGMGFMTAAMLLMAATARVSMLWPLVLALALFGMGNGMFQSPNNSTTLAVIAPEKHGMAGSMVALMRNFGSVVGTAISVQVFDLVSGWHRFGQEMLPEVEVSALIAGYQAALIVGAGFGLLGFMFSLSKRKSLIKARG